MHPDENRTSAHRRSRTSEIEDETLRTPGEIDEAGVGEIAIRQDGLRRRGQERGEKHRESELEQEVFINRLSIIPPSLRRHLALRERGDFRWRK